LASNLVGYTSLVDDIKSVLNCYVWRCLGSAGPERPSFI